MKALTIQYKFVELIPSELEEGILYISVEYCTAIHKCVCGCGTEVVTPLSPTDWKLTFDGRSVTLYPSIGNWSFECRSHYFIENGKVKYARKWTNSEIDIVRKDDSKSKKKYFSKKKKKRKKL